MQPRSYNILLQEFDDPNSTIANILEVVRDLGIAIDFAPSKLKQGVGEQAVFVLDLLAGGFDTFSYFPTIHFFDR